MQNRILYSQIFALSGLQQVVVRRHKGERGDLGLGQRWIQSKRGSQLNGIVATQFLAPGQFYG